MERMLCKPSEAAEILGLGRSKIYDLLRSGELPCVRIGKCVRIPMEALRQWVADRTTGQVHSTTTERGAVVRPQR